MDLKSFMIALLALVSWGVGSFIAKLATNRIGEKAVFFDILGYAPAIIIYCLLVFRLKNLFSVDKTGAFLAFLAGGVGSLGLVAFFILLTRRDASSSVPLTALYPALTAVLAFIFLGENITVIKVIGIFLATLAVFLLSL